MDPRGAEDQSRDDVTTLLQAVSDGDAVALGRLTPLVYEELKGIAHRQMSGERPGHTLQTTGLVHEAFIKMVDLDQIQLRDRAHFYALSSRLMRQILIDYAKRRRALKRGGPRDALTLDEARDGSSASDGAAFDAEEVIALDEALGRLAQLNERRAHVVECRFFGGLSVDETASALGTSAATVKRDSNFARAWLNRELS